MAVLLTGVPGLNLTGAKQADLLRLNTSIAPSGPVGTGNRLGVLAGEFAGYPNGRRLEDDVTDIEVRALACGYGDILAGALGLCNLSPNNVLGDGVDANEKPFSTTFPYLASPHQGYDHTHHGCVGASMRRTRLLVAATAAVTAAVVALLGGVLREAGPAAGGAAGPAPVSTERALSGFALGDTAATVARLQEAVQREPGGSELARAPRPRVPAAGARDRRRFVLRPCGARRCAALPSSTGDDPVALSGLASLAASRHDFRESLRLSRRVVALAPTRRAATACSATRCSSSAATTRRSAPSTAWST